MRWVKKIKKGGREKKFSFGLEKTKALVHFLVRHSGLIRG